MAKKPPPAKPAKAVKTVKAAPAAAVAKAKAPAARARARKAVPAPVADLSFSMDHVVKEEYHNDPEKPAIPPTVKVRLTLADGRQAYGETPATGDLLADQAAAKASATIPA